MRFGEAYYYFRCKVHERTFTMVLLSLYSDPHPILFKESLGTVIVCKYTGDSSLVIVDFTSIISVVAMVPRTFSFLDSQEDWRFVVEKPGLDIARLGDAGNDIDMEGSGSDIET